MKINKIHLKNFMCILLTVWQKILKQKTPFICFLFVWFSTCLCLLFHWSLFFNSFAPRPFLSLCGFFISNFRSFSAVNYFFQSFYIFFRSCFVQLYLLRRKKILFRPGIFFFLSIFFSISEIVSNSLKIRNSDFQVLG